MSQQQLGIQGIGGAREAWAEGLLGRIASMISVPREHDFGVDYYCLPRAPLAGGLETVAALAGVQVKGASEPYIEFGGANKKSGEWNRHELQWFRNLGHPYFLAIADESSERLNLFGVSRAIQVFWKTRYPFRLRCVASSTDIAGMHETTEPSETSEVAPTPEHDGQLWTVDLGAPAVSLNLAELTSADQRALVRNALVSWMDIDRISLTLFAMQIPEIRQMLKYFTNVPAHVVQVIQFQSPTHESRASDIAVRLAPGLETLVSQLLSESRKAEARELHATLRWCEQQGVLSELGLRLLKQLD